MKPKERQARYPGILTTGDGNAAVVAMETAASEAAGAYAITPATPMGEGWAEAAAEGHLNIAGRPLIFIEPEGEHAAAAQRQPAQTERSQPHSQGDHQREQDAPAGIVRFAGPGDLNGDGVADERKIFAHVHNPLGFEFWGGGVIVTSGPDLLFLKDTDGDDQADVRYPLLQGLGTADTHHAANNLVYGPDGGIYWQSGIFLVHNHETPWKQNLNTGGSGMYRFDPRRTAMGENPLKLDETDERRIYQFAMEIFEKHVGRRPVGFPLCPVRPHCVQVLAIVFICFDIRNQVRHGDDAVHGRNRPLPAVHRSGHPADGCHRHQEDHHDQGLTLSYPSHRLPLPYALLARLRVNKEN